MQSLPLKEKEQLINILSNFELRSKFTFFVSARFVIDAVFSRQG